MIAVDTQILVYAHRSDMPQHANAAAVITTLISSPAQWAIPWPCVHEFIATVTRPRYFSTPSTVRDALLFVESAVVNSNVSFLAESHDHFERLRPLLSAGHVVGPVVHDARIAAICLSHGVRELWTADRDFSRFPTLPTRNPLIDSAPRRRR